LTEILGVNKILEELKAQGDPDAIEGMARVGIKTKQVFGVKIPVLKAMAKRIGQNHDLAEELWAINSRETRILACMIEDYKTVTEEQLENWVAEFDFWEICDQCLMSLIVKTPFAKTKAVEWARREQEYVRRAGYVLMALLALKRMKTTNEELLAFLPVIKEGLGDDRRTVRLAISWALRQIGKRNLTLNTAIQKEVEGYKAIKTKTAQWVATDVLKDITREAILKKLHAREYKKDS